MYPICCGLGPQAGVDLVILAEMLILLFSVLLCQEGEADHSGYAGELGFRVSTWPQTSLACSGRVNSFPRSSVPLTLGSQQELVMSMYLWHFLK